MSSSHLHDEREWTPGFFDTFINAQEDINSRKIGQTFLPSPILVQWWEIQ